MRVIDELVRHFWERGELNRVQARYLIRHGFARPEDLRGWTAPAEADKAAEQPGRVDHYWPCHGPDEEDVLAGRGPAKARRGKARPRPAGHDLAPLRALLTGHFAARTPFAALTELGNRLRPCAGWADAAGAVAAAAPTAIEAALVGLLNVRPRALGELWFWFHIEPLADWAAQQDNVGPVAAALAVLLRATTPSQAGRASQLVKAAEVRDLLAVLAARRRFLAVLPGLYDRHFARLGQWLVRPAGQAAECWPGLPWAFVLLYNARQPVGSLPGYPVSWEALSRPLQALAWTTFHGLDSARAPRLLNAVFVNFWGEAAATRADAIDNVQSAGLVCPLSWRV